MGKTLNVMIKNLQSFVEDCYDTIALFLCLHLVKHYQLICHKRTVPALDKYWETLTATIWPRYCLNIIFILVFCNTAMQNYICFLDLR